MSITYHAFRGEIDLPRILALVRAMPLACPHALDLPWRLSSPTINEGCDAAFWEDANGQVVGFAAWQYYWAALDFFMLPGREQSLATEIFTWAEGRFRVRDEERGHPLPYWVEFRDDDQARRECVEAYGFLLDEHTRALSLQHSLVGLSPVPRLPDGFLLRILQGEQEAATCAELHRAAFASMSMTTEWRARTVRMPQYHADLDLVVIAPDGALAGYCLGWFEPARGVAQIEPIGVHPRFQHLGLGRALLLEMLRRFQVHGAGSAIIEPYADNLPILRACESVGFQPVHALRSKGKLCNQSV